MRDNFRNGGAKLRKLLIAAGVTFLIVSLCLLFNSCRNNDKDDYSAENSSEIQSSSQSVIDNNEHTEGIFNKDGYKSNWLNIQIDFAKNGLKASDPEAVQLYNDAGKKNDSNYEYVEMSAYVNNANQSPSVQIVVSKADKSLKELSDEINQEINSVKYKSPISVQKEWKEDTTIDLLGEEYLLSEYSFKTFYGTDLRVQGTNWWLRRIKDGYLVCINFGCSGDSSVELSDLMSWIEPIKE